MIKVFSSISPCLSRYLQSLLASSTCFLILFFLSISSANALDCNSFSSCSSNQYCTGVVGHCKTRVSAGGSCSILVTSNCKSGLVCDVLGECRNSPPIAGEPCGTGVGCASGLRCSSPIGGRCYKPKAAGQSCLGLGQANCASGLVCDILQECRHSPPISGERCGTGVACAGDLICSDIAAGRCQPRSGSAQVCFGIGQGTCQSGFVCDALFECRQQPSQVGELCGTGVPCAGELGCSKDIAGRCFERGASGDACSGVNQGSCESGLVCDFLRKCRHEVPEQGEACGSGVNCISGLVCSDIAAGQCQRRSGSTEPCWNPIGQGAQGTCQKDFVCDVLFECRKNPPQRGELCGRGVPCDKTQGLACNGDIAGRCDTVKAVGEICQGLGQGNCVDNSACTLTREADSGDLKFRCYPQGSSAIPEDICLSFYSWENNLKSRLLGTALTIGVANGAGVGASASIEIGTVYGPDGEYGCYDTTCVGLLSNASATALAVCAGVYNSYDLVVGDSVASVQSVSPVPLKPVSYSTSQVFPELGSFNLIGTSSCLSVGVGVLPLDVGVYQCATNVATYYEDSNDDGLADSLADDLTLDVMSASADTDADGVSDVLELGEDIKNPLDSDGDGVIDALESGEAANDASAAMGVKMLDGSRVNIVAAAGQSLSKVEIQTVPNSAPNGVSFPFGVLSYDISVEPGASVEINLDFSTDLPIELALYKVNNAGGFSRLPESVWQQTAARSLTLTLTDGDAITDLDAVVDGVIEDPVAIGSGVEKKASGSSGGALSLSGLLVFLFWLMAVRNRQRDRRLF